MGKPILVVNPRSDEEFVAFVDEQLDAGADTTTLLEQALRVRYPRAAVRERDLASETLTTWYVYREGRWSPDQT